MSFGDAVRKAMDSETIEPPKGPYKTRLVEAEAFEYNDKKTGDRRQAAKVILEIIDGDLKGSRFLHFMGFYPEGIAEMNGNACAAYGVDWTQVDDTDDLDDQLKAIVAQGTTAEVSVAYKNDYMNVNVHGSRVDPENARSDIPSDAGGFAAAATAIDGTDKPPF